MTDQCLPLNQCPTHQTTGLSRINSLKVFVTDSQEVFENAFGHETPIITDTIAGRLVDICGVLLFGAGDYIDIDEIIGDIMKGFSCTRSNSCSGQCIGEHGGGGVMGCIGKDSCDGVNECNDQDCGFLESCGTNDCDQQKCSRLSSCGENKQSLYDLLKEFQSDPFVSQLKTQYHVTGTLSLARSVKKMLTQRRIDIISFKASDLKDSKTLVQRLKAHPNKFTLYVFSRLSPYTRQAIATLPLNANPKPALVTAVLKGLNQIIRGANIYNAARFTGVNLNPRVKALAMRAVRPTSVMRANRFLLQQGLADCFVPLS